MTIQRTGVCQSDVDWPENDNYWPLGTEGVFVYVPLAFRAEQPLTD